MKGQLKDMIEEADKEKALKQVAEASLSEKNPRAKCNKAKGNYYKEGSRAGQTKGRGLEEETW